MIKRSRVQIPAVVAREFSSPGSTFCADSYFGIRSTPVLLQWHIKDPGHSAKSAGGRLQLNTHAPYICGFAWSDMALVWWTQNAPRRQQFHVAPAMSALKAHHFGRYSKTRNKKLFTHVESHVSAVSAREWRIALYKSNHQIKSNQLVFVSDEMCQTHYVRQWRQHNSM